MIKVHCAHDKMLPITELKPSPRNRNRHPEDQITRLAQILEYQGWRYPIKVSRLSGFITSGHGRLEAAKRLGLTEVPVNFQEYESEAQEYADIVADNSIASWSELDLAGIKDDIANIENINFDMLGLKDLFPETEVIEPQCDEDDVPDAVEPKTKIGDLYQLGNHRLLCGDSTNIQHVEGLFGDRHAEICFTSPPYADQREYNGGKELSTEHLAKFITTAYGKVNYFAVNLGYSRKDGEVNPYWDDYIKEAKACGLKLLSWNVWDRSGFGYTIGQATVMFTIDHEFIFVFGSKVKSLNRTIENKQANITKKSTIREKSGSTRQTEGTVGSHRQIGTVIRSDIARYVGDDHHKHPAMFPVSLPESYIEAMTNASEYVYEPFGGSGSTLIACEKTNRKCFMMELDPKYCDIIVARWEKYTGKKSVLLNEGDQTGTARATDEVK